MTPIWKGEVGHVAGQIVTGFHQDGVAAGARQQCALQNDAACGIIRVCFARRMLIRAYGQTPDCIVRRDVVLRKWSAELVGTVVAISIVERSIAVAFDGQPV